MRVLIIEGDSFLGSHIADRFYKEGHDVVCVYTKSKDKACFPSVPHTKYQFRGNLKHLERIVRNERPHVIVVTREEHAATISQLQSNLTVLTQLLDASVKYNTGKFIYVSSISVYGSAKELFTEEDTPMPETVDAQCHTLAEACILKWRYAEKFSSVILRMAEPYGQRQKIGSHHIVWKMMKQAAGKQITDGLGQYYSILYSGDAVDAVYKSTNSFVEGIYNITPDDVIEGNLLARYVSEQFGRKAPAEQLPAVKPVNADNTKACRELEFVNRVSLKKGIEHCYHWYRSHPEKKDRRKEKREKTDGRVWLRYFETVLLFFATAAVTYSQTGWSAASSVDFMMIYIILIGTFFGINFSVLASILSSLYYILSSVVGGLSLSSSLYDLNTMVMVVQNIVVGVTIGYMMEYKDHMIAEKDEIIESQASDLEYISQLYDEMGEAKTELELRISEYDDSYAKINYTIKKLDSIAPEEVFVNSLTVVRELIHEDNISLFIMDGRNMFLRRIASIGENTPLIPKTFRLKDYPKIEEIIRRKELFANSFMDTDLPSMLVPIVYDGKVVSLIVVDNMHFDKLNLYYVNLMRIIANIINSSFYRAQKYEQLAIAGRYIPNSPILNSGSFENELDLKNKLQSTSSYQFSVLEILNCRSEADEKEKAFIITKMIRSEDDIGKSADGKLCVLLSATSEADSQHVVRRMKEAGIEAAVLSRFTLPAGG